MIFILNFRGDIIMSNWEGRIKRIYSAMGRARIEDGGSATFIGGMLHLWYAGYSLLEIGMAFPESYVVEEIE